MNLKILSVFLLLIKYCMSEGEMEPSASNSTMRDEDATRLSDLESTNATKPTGRTFPYIVTIQNRCDGLAVFCMRAYQTGRICARTIHFNYETFKNYCMMDFVNCHEHYEVWQIVHMGDCFVYVPNKDYVYYGYITDTFLDDYYVTEPSNLPWYTIMNYE